MPLNSGILQTGTTSTTAQANEVCVGGITVNGNYTYGSPTNSFSIVHESTALLADLVTLERIVSSTGTFGSAVSFTGAPPVTWFSAGCMITLKAVASTNTQGLLSLF